MRVALFVGMVMVLAMDRHPGFEPALHGGGGERADSVLAALQALPADVAADALVLVHDAARPNLRIADIDALLAAARACDDGAILAAPVLPTIGHNCGSRVIVPSGYITTVSPS